MYVSKIYPHDFKVRRNPKKQTIRNTRLGHAPVSRFAAVPVASKIIQEWPALRQGGCPRLGAAGRGVAIALRTFTPLH